ncbi:hypothetical protein BGZ99_001709, partial [Dissophora globulifera]
IAALSLVAAMAAPVFAAKIWDVSVTNGTFSPQTLSIAAGDTVRWNMTDGNHAIVQTIPGNQTCTNSPGGFNSGVKTVGQSYIRVFPVGANINYKDGVGKNCANGATGSVAVAARSITPINTPTKTADSIAAPTSSSASGLITPKETMAMGVIFFISVFVL